MKIEKTKPQKEYELLDSGEGEKLERFGSFVLRRPDPQALWKKNLSLDEWKKADGYFKRSGTKGNWILSKNIQKSWNIDFGELKLKIVPSPFKHTGLFPEQFSNWQWMTEKIKKDGRDVKILNLFGYTGGATLACAKAGAEVVHIDASKSAIAWGKENAELSELKDAKIRWILEDAKAFVRRELKRGNRYDGILMDPPAFGHGPTGETWKIEEDLLQFIEDTKNLLSEKPLFYLINGYASGYSPLAYGNTISDLVERFGGVIEEGELCIEGVSGQLLPAGIFARWSNL